MIVYSKGKKKKRQFRLLFAKPPCRGCIKYVVLNAFRNTESLLYHRLLSPFSTLSIKKEKKCSSMSPYASSATRDFLSSSRSNAYVERREKKVFLFGSLKRKITFYSYTITYDLYINLLLYFKFEREYHY